ncbi:hypothetical protein [Sporosarcina sp. HYO08]|uniref:DUF6115 domain-containing protein n=1 Tax=Sporosarcina sp. HYO08 TaxID=1759557 RepID=UPI000791EE82|nr:hypothetical protein [Sporosarcina sp. HYO08]KXH80006.1 hypothetical protein AU377_11065 [Sporosarcina sp. HYO08]
MVLFVILLFVLQVIGFYVLALLYMKTSKMDLFEKRQQQVMEELNDTLIAYLAELKDENEKLIERLSAKTASAKSSEVNEKVAAIKESREEAIAAAPKKPIHLALKSYQSTANQQPQVKKTDEHNETDTLSQVLTLHKAGMSIEEIAKKLQKGQTEVELMLKFK